jgi:hypothetical protein
MFARLAPQPPTPPLPDETEPRRPAPHVTLPTHEEIAERARQIYLRNGCKEGESEQNWLQAERELISEMLAKTMRYCDEPQPADPYVYESWDLEIAPLPSLRRPARTEAA